MGGNVLYSIVWILLLFFVAWPIATIVSPFWILLMPFEDLLGCISDINGFLERFVKWPRDVGTAIVNCSNNCPQP